VKSHIDPSEASNLAISKFIRTNTGSVITEEDSSKNGNSKIEGTHKLSFGSKKVSNSKLPQSRYTKTDVT
jgi:hypothetical protein